MKIGVVTLFGFFNYGNRLQNYALVNFLNKLGLNTKDIIEKKRIDVIRSFYLGFRNGLLLRMCIFFSFYKRNIKFMFINSHMDDNVDYVVCGSDQIWNPHFGCSSVRFGEIVASNKRIAYSASFGVSEIPDAIKEQYRKKLLEMKAISVREESGARIVRELTGREVPVLVDPTMLLHKGEWQTVTKKPRFYKGEKYLLTYFLGNISKERRKFINETAKKHNLKIIALEGKKHNKYWNSTGPAEFVWMIEHADLVCTDSFHGSVFSILMETPFVVFNRVDSLGDMGSRIDTLLSKLNLEDRYYDKVMKDSIFEINYSHVPKILDYERKKAIDYLKNAMELK